MASHHSRDPERARRNVRPHLISDDDALLTPMTHEPYRELTPFTMAGLALLALVWVFLDFFDVIEPGTGLSAFLAFIPFAVWVAVVVWRDVSRPFATLMRIGIIFGAMLAVTHQVLWDGAGSGYPPFVGATVSELDEPLRVLIVRAFTVFTSMLTGVLLGVITGIATWGLSRFLRPPELFER